MKSSNYTKVAVPSAFPPTRDQSSCGSTTLPAFDDVRVFAHSNRYAVVSHCFFIYTFPVDTGHGALTHMLICHLCIFLVRCLFRFLCIFQQRCSFFIIKFQELVLYFGYRLVLEISFANTFSQSVAYHFFLPSFTKQEFLILIKYSLSISSFVDVVCYIQKLITKPRLSSNSSFVRLILTPFKNFYLNVLF